MRLNHWALSGDWTMEEQAATLNEASGQIAYRFHARDLHLVMGPAAPGTSVPFRVLLDGQPPGTADGTDVDGQGHGAVTEQRLHRRSSRAAHRPNALRHHRGALTAPASGPVADQASARVIHGRDGARKARPWSWWQRRHRGRRFLTGVSPRVHESAGRSRSW
jgi:hypothetical protein